jgi:fatty-acyl-CoA synthase
MQEPSSSETNRRMSGVPHFPRRPDPLRFWRRVAGSRAALVDRARGERLTYPELDAAADRWAAALRARGVGRGDMVATLAGNRSEVAAAFFACGRLGAALLPLNWRLAAPELAPILADARPKLILGEGRFRDRAEGALNGAGDASRWIDLDDEAPVLLARGGPSADDVEIEGEEPLLVLYTSGSTGKPKGAVLPHRQVFYNAAATTTAWELGAGDVAPVSTPFFHTGGWNVFATPLWHRGGTIVLFDAFDANDYLDAVAEEGITVALTVPTMLLMLTESPRWGRHLPSLRFFVSGGAPCPQSLAERVRAAGYTFREGYGLTECGPNCFAISSEDAARKPGSVGWPVPFLEMRLETEDGREAAPGEPGELLLRGPQLFAGYLRAPERTAEVLTEGGWLRTGDLARRDGEGAFTICGRRKEMFISGGENVFPGEVEAALADCPGVAEVVVVGVRDERWGEVGRAFVVRRTEAASVDETVVIAHARTRLAGYKVPRSVVFLPEIPRLGSGKPDRRALAQVAP